LLGRFSRSAHHAGSLEFEPAFVAGLGLGVTEAVMEASSHASSNSVFSEFRSMCRITNLNRDILITTARWKITLGAKQVLSKVAGRNRRACCS